MHIILFPSVQNNRNIWNLELGTNYRNLLHSQTVWVLHQECLLNSWNQYSPHCEPDATFEVVILMTVSYLVIPLINASWIKTIPSLFLVTWDLMCLGKSQSPNQPRYRTFRVCTVLFNQRSCQINLHSSFLFSGCRIWPIVLQTAWHWKNGRS